MPERQLGLFGGKRQRGRALPPPKEFALHVALAKGLRLSINPAWRFTHIPLGEYRDKATAAKVKAMGAEPGWPDFMFVGPGQVFFLELKRRGETPSDVQEIVAEHITKCGFDYFCTSNLVDAIDELRSRGIVRATVSV